MKTGLCYLEKVTGVSKCVPICRLYSVLLSPFLFVKLITVENSIWLWDCCCSSWRENSQRTGGLFCYFVGCVFLYVCFSFCLVGFSSPISFHQPFTKTNKLKIIFHLNFWKVRANTLKVFPLQSLSNTCFPKESIVRYSGRYDWPVLLKQLP